MAQQQQKPAAVQSALLRPRNIVAAAALVGILIGGIVFWRIRGRSDGGASAGTTNPASPAKSPIKPPPADSPRDQLIRFAATDDFIALSENQRAALANTLNNPEQFPVYVQMYFDQKITGPEAQQAFGNVAGAIAVERSRQYAAAATPEQRNAVLDKSIDEMLEAQEKFGLFLTLGGMGQLIAKAPGGSNSPTPQGVKNWVETHSGQDRERVSKFYRAVYDRMVERAIPVPAQLPM